MAGRLPGVFALAHEVFALHYILCKVLSYTTGAIVSYSLNRKITFRSCESFISKTLLKFLIVNIVSIGLSLLAMSAVVDYAGWNVWLGYFFSYCFPFPITILEIGFGFLKTYREVNENCWQKFKAVELSGWMVSLYG